MVLEDLLSPIEEIAWFQINGIKECATFYEKGQTLWKVFSRKV